MIKNVLLDADGTLFDFKRAEREALSQTLLQLGIEPLPQILRRYSEINDAHWKLLEKNEITHAELKYRRYEQLFREIGVSASPTDAANCYEELLSRQGCLLEGARELVERLAPSYRLYLASNGRRKTQYGRIDASGLKPFLSDVFISEDLGYYKPDVGFFEACFARIPDLRKEETVMVGDRLSSDIAGGNRAGIATVWFAPEGAEPSADALPTRIIHALSELPDVLAGM